MRIFRTGRCLMACLLWLGCGGGGGGGDEMVSSDGGNASCVPPGTKGNSLGIGKSCTKGGFQCDPFSFAKFCTVDFADNAPAFCTNQCSHDSECGEGAACTTDG